MDLPTDMCGTLHAQRLRRPKIDQLGSPPADYSRKIGDCRLPFCVGAKVALQLFACSNSIADLRIAKNNWPLASDDPGLGEFSEVVSRNVHRARIRLTLEKYRAQNGSESEPRGAVGNIMNEPSGDELSLWVSQKSLLAQHSAPVLDPKWSSGPNPSTPKRDAQARSPTDPDSKAPRVGALSYSRGDLEFPYRHAMLPPASYLISLAAEQFRLAGNEFASGWPTFSVLFPGGSPEEVIPKIPGIWRPTLVGRRAPHWILSLAPSRRRSL